MKGDHDDPLTVADMPFTIPASGEYWLRYGGDMILLPPAPVGSILEISLPPDFPAGAP